MNVPQNSRSRANSSRRETKTARQGMGEWTEVILFYLLPFLLFNGILFILVAARPQISIKVDNTKDYKTTTASITVQSLFPIKEFSSSQEGTLLPLTETKKGEYTADIVRNGVIEIYAKGLNGMAVTKYEHVNILDDVAPLVGETYSIQDGILSMSLEDSQSGVDFQSVFAVTPSGQTLAPLSVDRQTGILTFSMEEELLVIYANDLAGNGMQATFSTHIETLNPGEVPATQYPAQAGAVPAGESMDVAGNADPAAEAAVPENIGFAAEAAAPENIGFAAEAAAPENAGFATEAAAPENVGSAAESPVLPAETPAQQSLPIQQPFVQQSLPESSETAAAQTEEEIMIHIRTHE